ncbi:MAG TPA: dTMP kinase [Candidatus Saccharimonadales bacterium]|jgi:thymidylate kinase
MASGKYIVIEGVSGVGKSAVLEQLARELQAAQIPVQIITGGNQPPDITTQAIQRIIDDPRYPMGNRAEVLLYNAARSQTLEDIRRAVNAGTVCIADHSYLATLVTQYYGRGDITDYTAATQITQYAAGQMQPDLLLLLDAPVSTIKSRLGADQQARFDETYQERVRAGYLWEAKQRSLPILYTTDPVDVVLAAAWKLVSDVVGVHGKDKPAGSTNAQSVAEVLAANPPTKVAPVEPPVAAASLTAPADSPKPVATSGRAELAGYVTSVKGPVYGLTGAVPPAELAAALANASRNGGDVRAALLDELTGKAATDTPLLQQAIAAFGSDQVRQFTGQYMVVDNASHLLTALIGQGRSAACLELSGRHTDLARKDANGHYRYFIPGNLKGKPRSSYIRTMNQIFDTYAKLAVSIAAHIRAVSTVPAKAQDAAWRSSTKTLAYSTVRPLLPVAATTTAAIYASGQGLEEMITDLLRDELPEARTAGRQLLDEARKTNAAAFLQQIGKPDGAEADAANHTGAYAAVHQLAGELLPANYTAEAKPITLVSYTPHNELDIVAGILYEHSDLPLQKIQHELISWPYQRKVDVLTACLGGRPDQQPASCRALEKLRYSFDLITDYDTFRGMRHRPAIDSPERQPLSPRLGYDLPDLVDAAGATEAFEQCFDLSLQLYSELQAAGLTLEAQYATLLGHKLRWKADYDARQIFQLQGFCDGQQENLGCRKLVQQVHTQVAEVHPLIAGAMRFTEGSKDRKAGRPAADSTS